jgi:hypothetical protein
MQLDPSGNGSTNPRFYWGWMALISDVFSTLRSSFIVSRFVVRTTRRFCVAHASSLLPDKQDACVAYALSNLRETIATKMPVKRSKAPLKPLLFVCVWSRSRSALLSFASPSVVAAPPTL